MPIIVAAFVIAMVMRVAQGSATVALTTAAALISPTVAAATDLSQFDLCFIVIAIASGATVLSHVNDSGFWLINAFLRNGYKNDIKNVDITRDIYRYCGLYYCINWKPALLIFEYHLFTEIIHSRSEPCYSRAQPLTCLFHC